MSKREVDLAFEIDESSDVPLWAQLRQRIVYLIASGYLKEGDQLPTVRGLASELSINYNTVNKAYRSLVVDGYLESTRGRGVFVRTFDATIEDDDAVEISHLINDFISSCREFGLSFDDIQLGVSKRIQQIKIDEGLIESHSSDSLHLISSDALSKRHA